MGLQARRAGSALTLVAFVGLAGCSPSNQTTPGVMTVEGEGAAAPPTTGERLDTPPPGLELERVTVERGEDEVRVHVVPREAPASRGASAPPSGLPLWSFAVWTQSEKGNDEPTYWVAVSADPATTPGAADPLAVWLCDGDTLRKTPGTAECGERSPNSAARFRDEAIEVRIPAAELPGLGPVFWWSVTAAAGVHAGAPPWIHCVPRCALGDWRFPPASARVRFG